LRNAFSAATSGGTSDQAGSKLRLHQTDGITRLGDIIIPGAGKYHERPKNLQPGTLSGKMAVNHHPGAHNQAFRTSPGSRPGCRKSSRYQRTAIGHDA